LGKFNKAKRLPLMVCWPGIHGTKHRANRGLATPTVAYKILKAELYKLLIWKPLGNRITTNAMAPNGAS